MRKVRTPQSSILPNGKIEQSMESATENKPLRLYQTIIGVRVKRRCKRPPVVWRQATQGKPYTEQGQVRLWTWLF